MAITATPRPAVRRPARRGNHCHTEDRAPSAPARPDRAHTAGAPGTRGGADGFLDSRVRCGRVVEAMRAQVGRRRRARRSSSARTSRPIEELRPRRIMPSWLQRAATTESGDRADHVLGLLWMSSSSTVLPCLLVVCVPSVGRSRSPTDRRHAATEAGRVIGQYANPTSSESARSARRCLAPGTAASG
jgi:hypothetical protein